MRKSFLFIMTLILGLVSLAGCRAQRETSTRETRTTSDEIGMELRRVDSLWSSIAEKFRFRIEYYEPNEQNNLPEHPESGSRPAAPCSTLPASNVGLGDKIPLGGGMGAVKSIEISTERTEDRSSITAADSVVEQKTATTATLQEDKTTVARQDNGTWTIVSIVAAAALLIFLLVKFYRK